MNPKASVIIPVYQTIRTLELCLSGLENQSFREFEVIIGDDGSGPEMRSFVEAHRSFFPVQFVWHPDEGFRRGKILNVAFRQVNSEYCIFMDSDCIPHHHFVRDHLSYREEMRVLCGRRVNLSENLSRSLSPADVRARRHQKVTLGVLWDVFRGKTINWEESIRIPSLRFIHWKPPSLLGSNFSLERSLFDLVNGFNEDYVGYGLEDSDLAFRLGLAGAKFRALRHIAIQYHLYHKVREESVENKLTYEQTVAAKEIVCRNGLRKLK